MVIQISLKAKGEPPPPRMAGDLEMRDLCSNSSAFLEESFSFLKAKFEPSKIAQWIKAPSASPDD